MRKKVKQCANSKYNLRFNSLPKIFIYGRKQPTTSSLHFDAFRTISTESLLFLSQIQNRISMFSHLITLSLKVVSLKLVIQSLSILI